jgi:hypothetical protein
VSYEVGKAPPNRIGLTDNPGYAGKAVYLFVGKTLFLQQYPLKPLRMFERIESESDDRRKQEGIREGVLLFNK